MPLQTFDLEPTVQVGTTAMYQAFRYADMHNNTDIKPPGHCK